MNTLDEFRRKVIIIEGAVAALLRQAYVDRFVDTASDYFLKGILTVRNYRDGSFYDGYLWDCLKHSQLITEQEVQNIVPIDQVVLVFWDLHSSEKIIARDYWKFPKAAILFLRYGDLLDGKDYLPKDVYIFDDQMDWSVILTHETGWNNEPWLLRAVPDPMT